MKLALTQMRAKQTQMVGNKMKRSLRQKWMVQLKDIVIVSRRRKEEVSRKSEVLGPPHLKSGQITKSHTGHTGHGVMRASRQELPASNTGA